jgi:bifunctional DNA-binding transcriptional regulator/antitoxin component of YhaV-PrlF toxin-antitoxin module
MATIQEYLVSSSGQLSLPAAARHRWNLDRGGPVDVVDLGFAVMMLPKGQASRLLDDLLPRAAHAEFVASLEGDPDLATT